MTPQWFAEDFLRVYTKKLQFFGLVQAGYRAVLANMPNEFDLERPETLVVSSTLDSMAPTPPATEAPSTPKAKVHSRDNSFTFPLSASGPSTTPFSNISFTTVPPTFTPGSPSRNSKKRRSPSSAKRLHHQDSQTHLSHLSHHDGNPKKKQKQ